MQRGPHAANDADTFAEIDLGMTRRMDERHEHLARPHTRQPHVVFYDRIAARKAVFDPQPLENRFAVCFCFGGGVLSDSRIASMTGRRGPSFGFSGSLVRM